MGDRPMAIATIGRSESHQRSRAAATSYQPAG
jgi:hypothetical protein